MSDATLHRKLRRRKGLPEHLSAEYLRTPDIPAVAAEDILFDTLQFEQPDQVGQYGMHQGRLPLIGRALWLAAETASLNVARRSSGLTKLLSSRLHRRFVSGNRAQPNRGSRP